MNFPVKSFGTFMTDYLSEDRYTGLPFADKYPNTDLIKAILFDFMGYLTTLKQPLRLGASELSPPGLDALRKWSKKRGINIKENLQKGVSKGTAKPPSNDVVFGEQKFPFEYPFRKRFNDKIYEIHPNVPAQTPTLRKEIATKIKRARKDPRERGDLSAAAQVAKLDTGFDPDSAAYAHHYGKAAAHLIKKGLGESRKDDSAKDPRVRQNLFNIINKAHEKDPGSLEKLKTELQITGYKHGIQSAELPDPDSEQMAPHLYKAAKRLIKETFADSGSSDPANGPTEKHYETPLEYLARTKKKRKIVPYSSRTGNG